MAEVIRFKVGEEVLHRSEVISTVDQALIKFISSNWYEKNDQGEIIFYDTKKYTFFEECLLYMLSKKGLKLTVESDSATKQLLG